MKTLKDIAAALGRDISAVRRKAVKHGVPMQRAIAPGSGQTVLVLSATAEKQLRDLYPSTLKVIK